MMRSSVKLPFAFAALLLLPGATALAQDVTTQPAAPVTYSAEELDNLLAPIALYPDPILAQVLVAATFSDQLQVAADFVREHGTANIDDQPWDVSVRAVAHYPPVLNMMVERPDWTVALGQAYAAQSTDVMESVQHLRQMAQEQGNLASTPQQTVQENGSNIVIVPAQPRIIYVPTYDPSVIFFRHIGYLGAWPAYWSFGIGFPIGGWLTYDCDWYNYAVYYDGWMGGGWRIASRPFIRLTVAYVSPRYARVRINRNVLYRPVNYFGLRGYNTIHRTANFEGRARDRRGDGRVVRGGSAWNDGNRRGGEATPGGRDRSRNGGSARGGNEYNNGPTRGSDPRAPSGTTGRQGFGTGTTSGVQGTRNSPQRFGPSMVKPQSKPPTSRTIQPRVVRPEPRSKATPVSPSQPSARTIRPTIVRPEKRSGGEIIRATPTPSNRSRVQTFGPGIVRPQSSTPVKAAPRRPAPTVRSSSRSAPTIRALPRTSTVRAPKASSSARSRPAQSRSVRPATSAAARGKGRSGKGRP